MIFGESLGLLSLFLGCGDDNHHIRYRVGMMILVCNSIYIFSCGEISRREMRNREHNTRRHRDIVEAHDCRTVLRDYHLVVAVYDVLK